MMLEELGTDPGLSVPQGRYQNAVFLLPLPPSLPPYSGSGRAPSERASCDHKNAKKCLVLPSREEPIPATYNLPKNLMSSQSRE